MGKARPQSPDTGLIFLSEDLVCLYEGGRASALSTDPQSNWIVCVVIATPITVPSMCVQRRLERIQEDSCLFFLSVEGLPFKRQNKWKLTGTGGALGKKKAMNSAFN